MSNRIKINQADPAAYKAMMALEQYIAATPLTAKHYELIKIRASQVNGCAYCIDKHTQDARKGGEAERRIYNLATWRDTPFYDEQEQAILALTEEMTLIKNRVSDDTYHKAAAVLEPTYLTAVIMAIITINAWNRIGIGLEMQPAL